MFIILTSHFTHVIRRKILCHPMLNCMHFQPQTRHLFGYVSQSMLFAHDNYVLEHVTTPNRLQNSDACLIFESQDNQGRLDRTCYMSILQSFPAKPLQVRDKFRLIAKRGTHMPTVHVWICGFGKRRVRLRLSALGLSTCCVNPITRVPCLLLVVSTKFASFCTNS